MNVFNIICQVIFYSCLAFSVVMFVYYKIRQRKERKKKLNEISQEEVKESIDNEQKETRD